MVANRWKLLLPMLLATLVLLVANINAHAQQASQHEDASRQPLVVLTKPIAPFVMVDEQGGVRGFSIDLWRAVAARMGRDFTFRPLPDLKTMLADIRAGKGDVAIAAITITAERERQMDFSQPYFRSGLQIMVRNDNGGGLLAQAGDVLRGLAASHGFRLALYTLLIIILLAAHLIWLVERRRNEEHFHRSYLHGIWDGAYWALVTISTVGYGDKVPRTQAGRAVSMVLIVVGYMAYAWFTATIAATLTVANLKGDINGPDDLRGRVVATVAQSTSAAWLRQRPGVRLREVARIEQAYDLLARGEVDAVVYDFPALRYHVLNDAQRRFVVVGPVFKGEDYGIALQQGSPLREELNRALLQVLEGGDYQRLYRKWFGANPH